MNEHQDAAGPCTRTVGCHFFSRNSLRARGLQVRSEIPRVLADDAGSSPLKTPCGTRYLNAWLLEDTHLHLRTNAHHSTKAHAQDSRSLVACLSGLGVSLRWCRGGSATSLHGNQISGWLRTHLGYTCRRWPNVAQ